MLTRFKYLFIYSLTWIILFQLFRVLFISYQNFNGANLPISIILQSAKSGLTMDIAMAAYFLIIPTLLMVFTAKKWDWYKKTISIFTSIITPLVLLLTFIDFELYRAWGFKLDTTALLYLKTPKEALASVPLPLLLIFLITWLGVTYLLHQFFKKYIHIKIDQFHKIPLIASLIGFHLLSGLLIIPIRGGLQLAPLNQSTVYFSDIPLANHTAINTCWNFFRSLSKLSQNQKNPYVVMEQSTADSLVQNLYSSPIAFDTVISATQPNVILIIWESFTAKSVKELHGKEGVTPQFSQLIPEGLFFTNLYASGDRSDKGMVSILSGYPAQPTTSIIKFPEKSRTLPSLPAKFNKMGYSSSYYYGGESEFANMKSYFSQQGYKRIIDKNSFDAADMNAKWGAHDHVVLSKVLTDLDTITSPFFTTIFTLSSHEPFDVPNATVIKGEDEESKFLNSLHYADQSIGNFIKEAKTKSWWNNTLVVIIADHGHRLPKLSESTKENFHIPMLWLGGALTKKGSIEMLGSQTDFASTLLHQFNKEDTNFTWSRNLLSTTQKDNFAYFSFNNGYGWLSDNTYFVKDNVSEQLTESTHVDATQTKIGDAYLQKSFADYLKR